MKILQLKISLDHTWVNREVLVRKDITYHELHKVIQRVFGWQEYHLYEFVVEGNRVGDLENDEMGSVSHEATTTPVFSDKKQFRYLYDFGDGWEHTVRIVKEFEADLDEDYPVCIGGKRACPPEDCGGVYGYREILKNPEKFVTWLGYVFDPDDFSVEWANERLKILNVRRAARDVSEMSLLTQYILALANLYGIVHKDQVVRVYNSQNKDQIRSRDVEEIAENRSEDLVDWFIYPHQEYFVHESILENDEFDALLAMKGDKPHYVPKKRELLKYADETYFEKTKEYDALFKYVAKNFYNEDEEEAAGWLCEDVFDECMFGLDMKNVLNAFERREIHFEDIDQVNEVITLVMDLANNTRIWTNNGHTPHEIFEKFEKPNLRPLPDKPFVFKSEKQTVVKEEKVGRNDPCPCGSGKKYKKCCLGKDLQH